MSKPYHEILREAARVESAVHDALERHARAGGGASYFAACKALLAVRAQFVGHVNAQEPHLAAAVLSGYRAVFGPMPLETAVCDRLVRMAQTRDASWDFVRDGAITGSPRATANIFRMSWASLLPPAFACLGRAIDDGDAAGNLWPIACLFKASTLKGQQHLAEVVAGVLAGCNPLDTSREGLIEQFEAIRRAAQLTLNPEDSQVEAALDQLVEETSTTSAERARGG